MRVLGIIPARGGSKGVPRKNVKLLGGIPLINYTIKSVNESELLSACIVSTDDEEIAETSRAAGAKVPFIRPAHLAEDTTPTLPVLKHALEFMIQQGEHFEAICILQVTSPFRPAGMIDACIKKFVVSDVDTLVSVKKVPDHYNPHWVFEYENDLFRISTGEQTIIPRRQELPDTFYRDGMIYIVRAEQILSGDSLFGKRVTGYSTKGDCINIDSAADWLKAEEFVKKNQMLSEPK